MTEGGPNMFDLKTISSLNDSHLIENFSVSVQKEREILSEVVAHLSQILKRQLYAKEGYSSLFNYLREKFHYSESAAYRRIQAAKVTLLYPEILGLLEEGKVNLMTLSLIEPHVTKGNEKEMIERIMGKSKREVEFLLSELSLKKINYKDVIRRLPVITVKKEEKILAEQHENDKKGLMAETPARLEDAEIAQNFTSTGEVASSFPKEMSAQSKLKENPEPIAENSVPKPIRRIKIEFVAEEGLAKKIERAKEILRHKFPDGKFEDIFNQALEDLLEKRDPMRKTERAEKRNEKKLSKDEEKKEQREVFQAPDEIKKPTNPFKETARHFPSENGLRHRYIPQEIRRKVWVRDGGRCTYQSSSGKRCGEKGFLEMDHIEPFALGGLSTEENLRLLCARHNKWRAEKTFGRTYSNTPDNFST